MLLQRNRRSVNGRCVTVAWIVVQWILEFEGVLERKRPSFRRTPGKKVKVDAELPRSPLALIRYLLHLKSLGKSDEWTEPTSVAR